MTKYQLREAVKDRLMGSIDTMFIPLADIEAVIDVLNDLYREKHGRDVTELFGGWIPVTERLPECGQNVIWYDPLPRSIDQTSKSMIGCLSGCQSLVWIVEAFYPVHIFTHWMPLPTSPEANENAG